MFIRKKSFYQKKAFYGIVGAVIAIGIFINQIPDNTSGENIDTNINVADVADETIDAVDSASNADLPERPRPDIDTTPDRWTDAGNAYVFEPESGSFVDVMNDDPIEYTPRPSGYYLVKAVDGIIKVFYYDADGRETLLQNTNIVYALISEVDQRLFSQGVILDTQDELMDLLQDFDR
ncbi:MAG: hypothetical protein FWD00_00975 [Clostridiales bacterium]|nr:hypothetical protein [Clostridiales bacterium]